MAKIGISSVAFLLKRSLYFSFFVVPTSTVKSEKLFCLLVCLFPFLPLADDEILMFFLGTAQRYLFMCPYKWCAYKNADLKRHLCAKHNWTDRSARLEVSCRLKMFRYLVKDHHAAVPRPRVCTKCYLCVDRIDRHVAGPRHRKLGLGALMFREKHTAEPEITLPPETEPPLGHRLFGVRDRPLEESTAEQEVGSEHEESEEVYYTCTEESDHFKLANSRRLSRSQARLRGLPRNTRFRVTYPSAAGFIEDFTHWLDICAGKTKKSAAQIARHVVYIWKRVDPQMKVHPENLLRSKRLLENRYFAPLFSKLRRQLELPFELREPHNQASTICSRLDSLKSMLSFLRCQDIYLGIDHEDIADLKEKCRVLCKRLSPYINARRKDVDRWKGNTLLTKDEVKAYGQSGAVAEIHDAMELGFAPENKTKRIAVKCRNHLMLMACLGNALRCSNVINITLRDVETATVEPEFNNARCVRSDKYKTSLLYGEKIILFPNTIFLQILFYVQHYRPLLVQDGEKPSHMRYLFTPAGPSAKDGEEGKMDHPLVSNALTSAFKLANVLPPTRYVNS